MTAPAAVHSAAGQLANSAPVTVAAAIVLGLAVPVVTWWLIGDLSTTRPETADYVIRPLVRISPAAARVGRIVSFVLAIAASAWLSWASVRGGFDLRWWSVIGPLLALGMLLGLGWRVFTAGVIGANIGAGLYTFFVGPIILALAGWVIFRMITLLH
jgi:hypothetical protein